jgi:hypothetical protein
MSLQASQIFALTSAASPILSGADNYLINQFDGQVFQTYTATFIQYVAFSCRQSPHDTPQLPPGVRIALGTSDNHESILPFSAGITTDMIAQHDVLYCFQGVVYSTDSRQQINLYVDADITTVASINVVFGWVQYFQY